MNLGFRWFKVGSGYRLKRRLGSCSVESLTKRNPPLIVRGGFSFRSNELGELVF